MPRSGPAVTNPTPMPRGAGTTAAPANAATTP